jgi:hypothetical protein
VSQNPSLAAPAKSLIGAFLGLSIGAATLLSGTDARADDVGESIALQLSTNATNTYAFRGFVLKDEGLISQYDSDLKVALVDTESLRFMVLAGFWISLHPGDQAKTGRGPAAWYESRISGGLGVSARGIDALARLVAYSSPNDSFSDVYEINLEGRYRDDTLWAGDDEDAIFRGIFPHMILAQELKGARDGDDFGRYIELGVAPRVRVLYSSLLGIDFSLPVNMGLNFGGYYQLPTGPAGQREDYVFGFASFGAVLDFDLRMMPERLGLYHLRGYFTLLLPSAHANVPGGPDSVEPIGGVEGVLNF